MSKVKKIVLIEYMFLKMWPADLQLPPESTFVVHIAVSLSYSHLCSPPPSICPQFIKYNLSLLQIGRIM